MIYLYVIIAAVAPIFLIAQGKRMLGSSTHPAAIFILAWMLCSFLLSFSEGFPYSIGIISFAWVGICFAIITKIQKRRSEASSVTADDSIDQP